MNLDFSDDQKFLQSEAKKFLEKEDSIKRSRSVLDESGSMDPELWKKIVDLGWTGIRIPEEFDGLGLGHLELCVIAEELGRFIAPVPFSSSVYLFTETIIKYGNEDLKKDILDGGDKYHVYFHNIETNIYKWSLLQHLCKYHFYRKKCFILNYCFRAKKCILKTDS